MNTPPWLLGTTLLFWGWHTGLPSIAALAAVLLEGARLIKWRWDFSTAELTWIWNLCLALFFGLIGYLALTTDAQGTAGAVLHFFQWFPLTVFPIIMAQQYSTTGRVDLAVLSFTVGKRRNARETPRRRAINLSYPYFVACLLSTGTVTTQSPWFYGGLCLLSTWALWRVRPRVVAPSAWVGLLAAVVMIGYGAHVGLHALHSKLESQLIAWFILSGNQVDPYQSQTAIGSIGALKLSNRIVLRVDAGHHADIPLRIRDASYNAYDHAAWFSLDAHFHAVQAGFDGATWQFGGGRASRQAMTISTYLDSGKGLLALPNAAGEVRGLPVGAMLRNDLGAVKVEDGPGLIRYRVLSTPDSSRDAPPMESDFALPEAEAAVVSRIAEDLGLTASQPRDVLRTITRFFEDNFHYSRYLPDRPVATAPLSDFLLTSRSGHCEYFATATVLLLRAAGIPARYAVGYSAQEFSPLENQYVVRARDAHSWALVHIDGRWQDFDTTPSSWVQIEGDAAPWWEPLSDLWAWGVFMVSQWKWGERSADFTTYAGWLLVVLLAALAWRLYTAKRVARAGVNDHPITTGSAWPGMDSEWYDVERRLKDFGVGRQPWEPLSQWLQRIQHSLFAADSLQEILALHYRYRFDPKGVTKAERDTLASRARAWLRHSASRPQPSS